VLLVAGQWLGAHAIDWFPRGGPRTDARSLHILFGVLLAIVILWRLVWRRAGGRRLPPSDQGLLRWLALLVHVGLYALVIATVGLGVINAWVRGDSLFGLFSIPQLAGVSKDQRGQIEDVHGLCANAILVLAGLHASAALWHQYGRRDGVLARMIPVLRRGGKAHDGAPPAS
jgi:cytochrome b561